MEWLSQLCKKFPGGDTGTAAAGLPINSSQLGMERVSSSFGPHPFFAAEVELNAVIVSAGLL